MPPMITSPIELHEAAPDPLSKTSGIAPQIVAVEVINIGRRRKCADSIIAS